MPWHHRHDSQANLVVTHLIDFFQTDLLRARACKKANFHNQIIVKFNPNVYRHRVVKLPLLNPDAELIRHSKLVQWINFKRGAIFGNPTE